MTSSLPIRPNASQAVPEMWKRWNAMFADTGPRNLAGQLQLHAEMCDDSVDCLTSAPVGNVHCSPDFVLWHRAFLYYHEQILSAFGGTDMGLPYWDWSANRLCPPAYVANASTFSFSANLAHSKQQLGDENFSPDQITSVVAVLRSMSPQDAAMELFNEPIHQLPHSRLGWTHANDLMFAAGDPLFYGHHGNLDRLANHIFQTPEGIGWPAPSGISYHFVDGNKQRVCTTLDRFASMPSPYAGDQPINTSGYQIAELDDVSVVKSGGHSRVRTKLRFSPPLRMGLHKLVSGKGTPLGEVASLPHHAASDFVLWLTMENYRKARAEGVETTMDHVKATIPKAILVTKSE